MSIISKLAPLGAKNNIAILLAFNGEEVVATITIKPKKEGDDKAPTPVQISGPIAEVEKSIEGDLDKLTTRLLKHATTMDELEKELTEREGAKKTKVDKAKVAPTKKLTAKEKKAAKKAAKEEAKKPTAAPATKPKAGAKKGDDQAELPGVATSATSLLEDL